MKPDARLAAEAFLVGLTPLIPLPILDELVRAWLLRRGIREVAADQGVSLPASVVGRLAGEQAGCVMGCIIGVLCWPLRKLFRTVFYFLTIKECMDTMAQGAVRIEMVRRACELGLLPAESEHVRTAILQTLKQDLGSPVTGLFRHKDERGKIERVGNLSVRTVYWLVDAAGGVAACDIFSQRVQALSAGEE
jgi:hypothetical protein